MPSSIGSSISPTLRIWKRWSITQIESKPASSAARHTRASVSPIRASPPGHEKEEICRPIFTLGGQLPEEVHLRWHDDIVAHRALVGRESRRRARAPPAGGWSCPTASSAAEAISSATATTVECMTRPSASGTPRRSCSGAMPATPSATSTIPNRHGRPNESLTITAGVESSTTHQLGNAVADARGGRVGVLRQQGDDVAIAGV